MASRCKLAVAVVFASRSIQQSGTSRGRVHSTRGGRSWFPCGARKAIACAGRSPPLRPPRPHTDVLRREPSGRSPVLRSDGTLPVRRGRRSTQSGPGATLARASRSSLASESGRQELDRLKDRVTRHSSSRRLRTNKPPCIQVSRLRSASKHHTPPAFSPLTMLAPAEVVKTAPASAPSAFDLEHIKHAVFQGELGLREGGVPIGAALVRAGAC